jgi:rhodanese-related sulfurtransferase
LLHWARLEIRFRTAVLRCVAWAILLAVICANSAVGGLGATSAASQLALEATSATPEYADPALFRLTVSFHNRGEAPVVVIPARIRRAYRAVGDGKAEYLAYPGPPISPWKGAFALAAGASRSVELEGVGDGDGIWRLTPGPVDLVVRYAVEPELAAQTESLPEPLREVALWVGALESESLRLWYAPEGAPASGARERESHISPQELLAQIAAGTAPTIVDVRSRSEYEKGHVPGAIHIPFWAARSRAAQIPTPPEQPLVIYCAHGPRAGIAKAALRTAGYRDVIYLEGHMTGWERARLPEEVGSANP